MINRPSASVSLRAVTDLCRMRQTRVGRRLCNQNIYLAAKGDVLIEALQQEES
jgi:hypothetical protein